jgi:hypothetical protein
MNEVAIAPGSLVSPTHSDLNLSRYIKTYEQGSCFSWASGFKQQPIVDANMWGIVVACTDMLIYDANNAFHLAYTLFPGAVGWCVTSRIVLDDDN